LEGEKKSSIMDIHQLQECLGVIPSLGQEVMRKGQWGEGGKLKKSQGKEEEVSEEMTLYPKCSKRCMVKKKSNKTPG